MMPVSGIMITASVIMITASVIMITASVIMITASVIMSDRGRRDNAPDRYHGAVITLRSVITAP